MFIISNILKDLCIPMRLYLRPSLQTIAEDVLSMFPNALTETVINIQSVMMVSFSKIIMLSIATH